MGKRRSEWTIDEILTEREDVELTGFYDRGSGGRERRVVILAASSKPYRCGATEEYTATDAAGLIARCAEAGYDLGMTVDEVEETCKPPWAKPRKRTA